MSAMPANPYQSPRHVFQLKLATILVVAGLVIAARDAGALRQFATSFADQDTSTESSPSATTVRSEEENEEHTDREQEHESEREDEHESSTSQTPATTTTNSTTTTTNTTTTSGGSGGSTGGSGSSNTTGTYRDGTYSADGSYDTPGGTQKIGITLVISGGVVVNTSAVNKAVNLTSRSYENDFIANYKSYVIGKKLSDLNLGKVSGASLTPNGFNNAANLIKTQAS